MFQYDGTTESLFDSYFKHRRKEYLTQAAFDKVMPDEQSSLETENLRLRNELLRGQMYGQEAYEDLGESNAPAKSGATSMGLNFFNKGRKSESVFPGLKEAKAEEAFSSISRLKTLGAQGKSNFFSELKGIKNGSKNSGSIAARIFNWY